jgi:hypothetical protein
VRVDLTASPETMRVDLTASPETVRVDLAARHLRIVCVKYVRHILGWREKRVR